MMFELQTWGKILEFAVMLPGKDVFIMFWFLLLFEVPRYALSFPGIVMMYLRDIKNDKTNRPKVPPNIGKVSVLIAGHNESDAIEHGVKSLIKQSFRDFEIVCVSDGSTDDTYEIMKRLQREGLVQKVAGNQTRGGKASAINLAARLASGDILIVIDCDCTFEHHAIAEILAPFADPLVGGISASVLAKNGEASFCASLQAIEYLSGMVLGKAQMDLMGQLCMISGAFGAFRREAWNRVNGMDPGPGEDLDISLRIRFAGYKLAFAHRAVAYTDVPTTLFNLFRQRNRWERDSIWLRFRKHGWMFNPFHPKFSTKEVLHQWDFVVFTVLATFIFPVYMTYVALWLETSFWPIMAIAAVMTLTLDFFVFCCAVIATGNKDHWKYLPYVFVYGFFQSYIMRMHRLWSFSAEWIYSVSRTDAFAPPKVNAWIRWK
jgi:cellulose synthase/poly-beta-1,6-N-acetylglucosamine synthase-like glycosyltransferase